jgi:Cu-processing system permease protein
MFAAVFAALAIAVAGSGYILSGGSGFQDFARTAVSLVQLVLLIVPLMALVIGVLALAPDRGSAELLYAQPIPRHAILFGKLIGLFEALAAAQAIGFGASGLLIYSQGGEEGIGGFFFLVGGSLALTAFFLGIAAVIAAGSIGRRARALALALIAWFATVILYDVVVLGVATLLRSGTASRLLITAVLVNPVDAVRTGVLLGIEGAAAFGAASLAFLRFTHGPVAGALLLVLSVALWILLLPLVAAFRLRRCDI